MPFLRSAIFGFLEEAKRWLRRRPMMREASEIRRIVIIFPAPHVLAQEYEILKVRRVMSTSTPGFMGQSESADSELNPAMYDWRNPVAKITIERIYH